MIRYLIESLLVVALVVVFTFQLSDLGRGFVPVVVQASPSPTVTYLKLLGAPRSRIKELSAAIDSASSSTKISPALICALMFTESQFSKTAIGPPTKGGLRYKGLMQTPWASFTWADVDTLYGARILCEKLLESRGDLHMALALYKGGDNPIAWRNASEVLYLYKRLLREEVM